jgi:hypothetical protein
MESNSKDTEPRAIDRNDSSFCIDALERDHDDDQAMTNSLFATCHDHQDPINSKDAFSLQATLPGFSQGRSLSARNSLDCSLADQRQDNPDVFACRASTALRIRSTVYHWIQKKPWKGERRIELSCNKRTAKRT